MIKQQELELLPECPFYLYEKSKSVICEGISDHSIVELRFKGPANLRGHMQKFCCSMDYEGCPVGKMLFEKYKEENYG